ncbi:MAG: trimeric intracellular cation channel family protein [Firmicutes bacterium]|nr:trimeric intracellular cation channel family protein [Bacillota bacterium]
MDFITIMEWIGTIAFAVSGAVVAIEKEMDYYGIGMMAVFTAIGGGIVRDLLLDRNLPASIENPSYAIVSLITAAVVIFCYHRIDKIGHLVSIADAIGLAAFASIGSQAAALTGHTDVYTVVIMAMLTGVFGGAIRDICCQEIPRIFRREVYAVACIVGGIVYAVSFPYLGLVLPAYICFGVTLVIRLYAVFHDLHLGKVSLSHNE